MHTTFTQNFFPLIYPPHFRTSMDKVIHRDFSSNCQRPEVWYQGLTQGPEVWPTHLRHCCVVIVVQMHTGPWKTHVTLSLVAAVHVKIALHLMIDCVYVWVGVSVLLCTCHNTCVQVKEQFVGVDFLFLQVLGIKHSFWGWWWMSSSTEPLLLCLWCFVSGFWNDLLLYTGWPGMYYVTRIHQSS